MSRSADLFASIAAANRKAEMALHNLVSTEHFGDYPSSRSSKWIERTANERGIWLQALEWQDLMDEYRAAVMARLEARALARAVKPSASSKGMGGRL